MTEPRVLDEAEIQQLDVQAGLPDVRRDIHHFVQYVEEKGLVRTVRENGIPKSAARALARLLSDPEEGEIVDATGRGHWSDTISHIARGVGLVSFDTEGSYLGYSSSSKSFPDNEVTVDPTARTTWMHRSALEKERAILDHCVGAFENEFFNRATLGAGHRFDRSGSAVGVAGAMNLAAIRRGLLGFLATLEPMRWLDFEDLVTLLQQRLPHLILDPATREPTWEWTRKYAAWEQSQRPRNRREKVVPTPPPAKQYNDLYSNFREFNATPTGLDYAHPDRLTEATPKVFRRVEGRFLEFFLEEIPLMLRLVDLAYRPETDPLGLDVSPSLGRLRGVRILPRLRQILQGDPAFDRVRVTVLPDFQVMVEAPSYPDDTLDRLAPFTRLEREEAPVWTLRIDRDGVVRTAAQPDAPQIDKLLEQASGMPLPPNVATELASWTRRGEKLVIYKDFSLVEILDEARRPEVLTALGPRVVADTPDGFLLAPLSADAHDALLQAWQVPHRIRHPAGRFSAHAGRLAPEPPPPPPRLKVRYETEAGVIVRVSDASLAKALLGKSVPGLVAAGGNLFLPATALPRLRQEMAALADRFDIEAVKTGDLTAQTAEKPARKGRGQSRSSTR